MSFFTEVEHWFTVFEEDIVTIILKIKQGFTVLAHEIDIVLNWVANNVATIAKDMQLVESIILTVSPTPAVETAIAVANEAMVALNAYAQAHKLGQSTAQAAVDGYNAFKQAQAAASQAVAISLTTPALAPATLF